MGLGHGPKHTPGLATRCDRRKLFHKCGKLRIDTIKLISVVVYINGNAVIGNVHAGGRGNHRKRTPTPCTRSGVCVWRPVAGLIPSGATRGAWRRR